MVRSCAKCKKTVGVTLVLDGLWHCVRCVYADEVGNPDTYKKPRTRPSPLQDETLFSVGPYVRRR